MCISHSKHVQTLHTSTHTHTHTHTHIYIYISCCKKSSGLHIWAWFAYWALYVHISDKKIPFYNNMTHSCTCTCRKRHHYEHKWHTCTQLRRSLFTYSCFMAIHENTHNIDEKIHIFSLTYLCACVCVCVSQEPTLTQKIPVKRGQTFLPTHREKQGIAAQCIFPKISFTSGTFLWIPVDLRISTWWTHFGPLLHSGNRIIICITTHTHIGRDESTSAST